MTDHQAELNSTKPKIFGITKKKARSASPNLSDISKRVLSLVSSNKRMRIRTLERIISGMPSTSKRSKNIQRRVYDAVNVMKSIGLLRREKGRIEISQSRLRNALEISHRELSTSINIKKSLIVKLSVKLNFARFLVESNRPRRHCSDIDFPFFLVKAPGNVMVKMNSTGSRLCVLADRRFDVITEDQIAEFFYRK